ncbi:MAG: UMP kinase [Nanoarchaeota archaeon]
MEKQIVVISLGGSLIVQENIDINFLKEFRKVILKYLQKDMKFIVICGGGRTARNYQNAAKEIANLNRDDLDWIGIHATRINAHLIRTIFRDYAHPKIIKNPTEKIKFKEKILVASGWKPGFSTDYDAVLLAKNFNAKKLVNLSNINYIYDKDPKKFPNAKIIKKISWKDFRKIVGNKWDPGLNAPFDPIASKEAQKLKMEVAIMNGKNLENFEKYLNGDDFVGSIIK